MTQPLTAVAGQEFAELGAEERPERRWLNTPGGGHVSGVFWGGGTPEVLLLHDAGGSARDWDGVVGESGRPAVAVDLPGHGRSNWRGRGDYRPRRLAGAVAGAAQSFAPAGTPVVGRGLGALVGIAANAKAPGQLGRLVLVDTLPGSLAALKSPWPVNSPDFADQLEARDWLAARIGEGGDVGEEAERSARLETIEGADGRWSWRHHLATLPEGTPTVLDDESLWAQLAAAEAPLLIRTEGGPLDDKAVARFTADVPGGETATTEPGPAALAAVLNTLLA